MATDFTFAYGSNMNSSDLRSWLERNGYDSSLIVALWPAELHGHDYVWNYYSRSRGGGAANLEPKERSVARGVLIEFHENLLKAFDRKEGHPAFYSRGDRRINVTRLEDGQEIPAWIYFAAPNKQDRRDIWPTREYKNIILEAATKMCFPDEHLEKIRAWPIAG